MERKSIKKLRFGVLKDSFTSIAQQSLKVPLEVDHIHPVCKRW
jgi:hypothetical protein